MNKNENNYLPSGWALTTFGEVAVVVGGGTPDTRDASNYDGGDIPWITPADLSGYKAKYISQGARCITVKGLNGSGARMLPAGTVLFSSRAPIGYVAIASNPVCTNQGFKSFVLPPGMDSEYVYYYLKSAKEIATGLASGTTFLELSGAKAATIPIPVAPTNEQKRIVAEIEKQFSRLDAAVTALKRVQANLKRYRAVVLRAACEGRLVSTEAELARQEGRDYEPADALLQRILCERRARWEAEQLAKLEAQGRLPLNDTWKVKYQEPALPDMSGLPELPEGWCWARLDMVTESLGGFAFESKRFAEHGYQVIKMANVRMGKIDLSQRPTFIADVEPKVASKYQLRAGDVVITLTGTRRKQDYGYAAVIKHSPSLLLNQRLARLRPYSGLLPSYLQIALQSDGYRMRFFAYETGNVGQGNVGMAAITQEPIPLPPLKEQEHIVAELERRLSLLDEVEASVAVNCQRAERLRQAVLQRAFSGKLVPQDPNDEPASVLLERIRESKKPVARNAQPVLPFEVSPPNPPIPGGM